MLCEKKSAEETYGLIFISSIINNQSKKYKAYKIKEKRIRTSTSIKTIETNLHISGEFFLAPVFLVRIQNLFLVTEILHKQALNQIINAVQKGN